MKLHSANLSTVFAQSDVPGLCAVSGGGTPLSKNKKNIVPPHDMASKPMLVCRWPPGRQSVSAGEIWSLGVLEAFDQPSVRICVRFIVEVMPTV